MLCKRFNPNSIYIRYRQTTILPHFNTKLYITTLLSIGSSCEPDIMIKIMKRRYCAHVTQYVRFSYKSLLHQLLPNVHSTQPTQQLRDVNGFHDFDMWCLCYIYIAVTVLHRIPHKIIWFATRIQPHTYYSIKSIALLSQRNIPLIK